MPSSFSRVFRSLNSQPSNLRSDRLPMINSLSNVFNSFLFSVNQIRSKQTLMNWFKTIPELNTLGVKVAKDVVYKYHFEPVDPSDTSREKILEANKFAQKVNLRKVMFSQALDFLITGEGYGWIGKIKKDQLKKTISRIVENKVSNLDIKERKSFEDDLLVGFTNTSDVDEDILKPRKYRYVPSTTVEVIHDEYDVLNYRHVVGTKDVIFDPEEIVRFTIMEVDGRITGFTPVESILVQLELLRQMWQNNLSLHKNGGVPDKVFSLEDVNVNSQDYKRIEQQLKKYKLVENKHGNMLWTGKLTIHDLTQIDDMQFTNLGLYITSVIAMMWQVPRSSLPYIMSGANTKDDTGGNSERGYWRNIEYFQEAFAEVMNTQVWIPYFGVKIVFQNNFVLEDVQFQNALMMKLNNILTMDQVLAPSNLRLTKEARLRSIGRTSFDVEEFEKEDPVGLERSRIIGTENQMSNDEVSNSDDQNNIKKRKKREQQAVEDSTGKPSGFGKEAWKSNLKNPADKYRKFKFLEN